MPKTKRKTVAKPKTTAKPSSKSKTRSSTKAKGKAEVEAAAVSQEPPFYFWKETDSEGGFLSPWYKSSFQIDGVTYESAGQCILASKARAFHDEEALQKILVAKSVDELKTLGDSVKGFNARQWGMQAWVFAQSANIGKFLHGAESKDLLKRLAELGDRELVYADPSDSYFGIGFNATQAEQVSREQWGNNVFGKSFDIVRRMVKQPNELKVESPFDKFGGNMNVYW